MRVGVLSAARDGLVTLVDERCQVAAAEAVDVPRRALQDGLHETQPLFFPARRVADIQ